MTNESYWEAKGPAYLAAMNRAVTPRIHLVVNPELTESLHRQLTDLLTGPLTK